MTAAIDDFATAANTQPSLHSRHSRTHLRNAQGTVS